MKNCDSAVKSGVGICFCELPFLKPERLCKDLSGSEEAFAMNVGCFNVKPPDSKLWALPPPFPALPGCCRTAGGTHLVRTVGRIGRLPHWKVSVMVEGEEDLARALL